MELKLAILILLATAAPGLALPEIDITLPPATATASTDRSDVFVDLDLSSPLQCVPASLAFALSSTKKNEMTVQDGTLLRVVTPSTILTAGEFFATMQIATGEKQTVLLSDRGLARGGTCSLEPEIAAHCRSLVVPRRVTVLQKPAKVEIQGLVRIAGNYILPSQYPSCKLKALRIRLDREAFIGTQQTNSGKWTCLLESKYGLTLPTPQIAAKTADANQDEATKVPDTTANWSSNSEWSIRTVRETLIPDSEDELIRDDGQQAINATVEVQERPSCQRK